MPQPEKRRSWLTDIVTTAVPALVQAAVIYHELVDGKPFKETTLSGEPVFAMFAIAAVSLMPIGAVAISLALARDHELARPVTAALIGPLLLLVLFWLFTPSPAHLPQAGFSREDDTVVKAPRDQLIEARSELVSRIVPITAVGLLFAVVAASPVYIVRRRQRMRAE